MARLGDELRGSSGPEPSTPPLGVSVIMTVKNDPVGCAATLGSLKAQSRRPDEIIVVDGGSTDATVRVIRQYADEMAELRLIESPGANIAMGRNIATAAARFGILATTDAGCRAHRDWLSQLIKPFEADRSTEFVAGYYHIAPQSLLEQVVGAATMRGGLDPVDPQSFNPSARSMAYTKDVWVRAGGWPEWVRFSEDTLFDHKLRRMDVHWVFAGDAIVDWRPRTTMRGIAKQFYNYGTGRGHTQIGAADFAYNLRNLSVVLIVAAACFVNVWFAAALMLLLGYFYVWSFHDKASRIALRSQRLVAYPLCIVVMWVVLFANTAGYVMGSIQRLRDRERFRLRTEAYLAGT